MPVEKANPRRATNPLRRLLAAAARRADAGLDWLVLRGHRLASRFDLIPPEFGGPYEHDEVDEEDPKALRAEWLRQLRLWVDQNPEEVFALQVGGGLLLATLAGLWLVISAMH